MADGRIQLDESKWPLVFVVWPGCESTDEQFEEMLARMSGYSLRGEPYGVLHDARKAVRPTPNQRKRSAEQAQADAARTSKLLRGVGVVVSNRLIASVLTAINWAYPLPFPQRSFHSYDDALAWVQQQLATPPK
jgi:hypothetical protein